MKPIRFNRFLVKQLLVAACITYSAHSAVSVATKAATGTDLTGAAVGVWTGGEGTNGSPDSDDVATWDSTSLGAGLTVGSGVNWGSIGITGAQTDISITGAGTITTGNITLAGTKTLTIANNIALSGNSTYNIGRVTGATTTDATLSGIISGAYSLTKTGSGTLTLSNLNNYTGGTTVSGGILSLATAGAGNGRIRGALDINTGGEVQFASWALGSTGLAATSVTTLNITGGILNKADTTALNGGLVGATINMTGGAIKGSGIIIQSDATAINALNTLASASTATITAGIQFRGFSGSAASTAIFTVADGAAATDLLVSGVLAQNGVNIANLTKAGAGTMTLTAANTYTGVTKISDGTLSISATNNLGTAAVAVGNLVLDGGTLQYTGATASTNRGFTITTGKTGLIEVTELASNLTISGGTANTTGALTKLGLGTLTLSGTGTNLYTGATTVDAGTLNLTGTLTSAITVNSGATLTGTGSTTGNITFNNGSSILLNAADAVQGTDVTVNATTNVFTNTAPAGAVVRDVIRYTGITPGTANFSAASNYRSGVYTDTGTKITLGYTGETKTWSDAAGDWEVGTASQWTGGTDTSFYWGDSAAFGAITANRIVTLNGQLAPTAVTVSNAANTYTFSGSGGITGPGSLTKSGAGTLELSTVNTYTGGTTISGGTLALSGGNNRLATSGTVNFSGSSTLAIGSTSQSLANITVADSVTGTVTGSSGTLTVTGATMIIGGGTVNNVTQSLDLSGLGTFAYNNAAGTFQVGKIVTTAQSNRGVVTLATNNTITASTLNVGLAYFSGVAGTLHLGESNIINANTINVGNAAGGVVDMRSGLTSPTVTIRDASGGNTANIIVGSNAAGADFSGANAAKMDLTGATVDINVASLMVGLANRGSESIPARSFAGIFTMNAGTFQANTVTLGQATVGTNGYTTSGTFNLNGGTAKIGTLSLVDKMTTANITTSGVFVLDGGAILRAGQIQPGASASGGTKTRTFTWNNGAIKNYDSSADLTFGTGIALKLAATGTHTFDIDTSRAATVASVLADATTGGTLAKAGAGTLTLNGVNTYTGNTTISGGTLTLADNAQLAFVIGANGVNNKITGTGTALLQGDFNLNLAGANTTTGNEWTLVDVSTLSETFDSTFTLVGFTETSNVHTKVDGSTTWTFTEATGKLTVAAGADYSGWAGTNAPSQTAGQDYDNDGVSNGAEWVLGGTAATNDVAKLPTVSTEDDNLVFTFTRDQASKTADTAVSIQVGTDLANWPLTYNVGTDTDSSTDGVTITPIGGGFETVKLTIPQSPDTKKFARLNVVITP